MRGYLDCDPVEPPPVCCCGSFLFGYEIPPLDDRAATAPIHDNTDDDATA